MCWAGWGVRSGGPEAHERAAQPLLGLLRAAQARKAPSRSTAASPSSRSQDTALFPRLVLGWIKADFRVQIRIFSAFFRIYKKIIFSRANLANFCQKITKFCKIFDFFLTNFGKFSEIRKIFAKFCRIFGRILQKCVDFEKCWKMLYWMQKFFYTWISINLDAKINEHFLWGKLR